METSMSTLQPYNNPSLSSNFSWCTCVDHWVDTSYAMCHCTIQYCSMRQHVMGQGSKLAGVNPILNQKHTECHLHFYSTINLFYLIRTTAPTCRTWQPWVVCAKTTLAMHDGAHSINTIAIDCSIDFGSWGWHVLFVSKPWFAWWKWYNTQLTCPFFVFCGSEFRVL